MAENAASAYAEREFEYHDGEGAHPVLLRIGKPAPDPAPDGDWRCAVDFVGLPDGDGTFYAVGVDSLQALLLALSAATARLKALRARGSALTWEGQAALGIPGYDEPG